MGQIANYISKEKAYFAIFSIDITGPPILAGFCAQLLCSAKMHYDWAILVSVAYQPLFCYTVLAWIIILDRVHNRAA